MKEGDEVMYVGGPSSAGPFIFVRMAVCIDGWIPECYILAYESCRLRVPFNNLMTVEDYARMALTQ